MSKRAKGDMNFFDHLPTGAKASRGIFGKKKTTEKKGGGGREREREQKSAKETRRKEKCKGNKATYGRDVT